MHVLPLVLALAAVEPTTAAEDHDARMKALTARVADLKEQVQRSKAKLQALSEHVVGGAPKGSPLRVVHRNQVGSGLRLVEARYVLDGALVWSEVDEEGKTLTAKKDVPVWDGAVLEGNHTLTVHLVYRGGDDGLFSYVAGYKIELKDSVTFHAKPDTKVQVVVVGHEQGGVTTELVDRPKIRFDVAVAPQAPPVKPAARAVP